MGELTGAVCECGHRVTWHHDIRGCGYHGYAVGSRCSCRLSSDAVVEQIVAGGGADTEARLAAVWDEGYDARRQFCRTGHYDLPEQNPYRAALDPAPTTDADDRDERRDGAGGTRWERG